MKNLLQKLVGLLLFCLSLTVLFLSMRAVLLVGGTCAEGGPYAIQVDCPGGTAYLTPLSIFAIIIGAMMYFAAQVKNSPEWGYLFWSALFLSLGWNFLEFGIKPPGGNGPDIAWLVCAVIFGLMGAAPMFAANKGSVTEILFGKKAHGVGVVKFRESQSVLFVLHVLALVLGIFLGVLVFSR